MINSRYWAAAGSSNARIVPFCAVGTVLPRPVGYHGVGIGPFIQFRPVIILESLHDPDRIESFFYGRPHAFAA